MLLILLTTLLLAGIAFYQIIQGMFSAMIMTILTVLSAALAFNFYEPLAELLASRLGAYSHPVALLGIFVIALYALREIYDRLIKGNVVMGMWPDRIGGAAFGLITGFLLVGVLITVVLMLPFGAKFLAYQPYDSNLAPADGGTPRWAGNFTLGVVKLLSAGSLRPMRGENRYGLAHDDLLLDSFCLRNRPPGGRASAPVDGLTIKEAYRVQVSEGAKAAEMSADERRRVQSIEDATPRNPLLTRLEEQSGTVVLAIRAGVDETARDKEDDWWRLPATHFRLVTDTGRSFYPIGYLTWSGGRWMLNTTESKEKHAKIAEIAVARPWSSKEGPPQLIVDWIYRVPKKAKCEYLVFRRTAKAPIPLTLNEGLPDPYDKKGAQIALKVKPKVGQVGFRAVGAASFVQPKEMKVGDRLPRDLRPSFMAGQLPPEIMKVEYTAGKMTSARIAGAVSALSAAPAAAAGAARLFDFNRPGSDSLIIQVNCTVNRSFSAGSLRGRLPMMNPQLMLDNGKRVAHNGVIFLYGAGGPHVYLYYDAMQPASQFDPVFAQTFLANLSRGQSLTLVFVVTRDSDRRIEGLSFGPGGPEFYPESPLACSGS